MDQKQQIAERLKQANNILVTVSNNPSVDQLAACIGLTLALNKMGKHTTALFSGAIPSTIEFLQPEQTLESSVDSLRDFIISLDKTKADKLRYKVEDKMVKIYITPYHTSLSDKDLEFSQGDFNVEVVIALGVHAQAEVDQAISAHGRILHDATVATINVKPGADLGGINWLVPNASSLSELGAELVGSLDKKVLDAQIATALLTGIVAETARFSNEKTSPTTMSISAELMAAGANQQLVITKLEEATKAQPAMPAATGTDGAPPSNVESSGSIQLSGNAASSTGVNGVLEISRNDTPAPSQPAEPEETVITMQPDAPKAEEAKPLEESRPVSSIEDLAVDDKEVEKKEEATPKIRIDDQGGFHAAADDAEHAAAAAADATTDPTQHMGGSHMILQPPSMGSAMSAAMSPNDSFSDPLSPAQPTGSFGSPTPPFGSPASTPPAPVAVPTPFTPPFGSPAVASPPAPKSFMAPPVSPLAGPPLDLAPAPVVPDAPVVPALGTPVVPPHVDNARDAVSQAFSSLPPAAAGSMQAIGASQMGTAPNTFSPAPMPPPDLPSVAPMLPSNPSPAASMPMSVPPPVPPPMMPPSPQ